MLIIIPNRKISPKSILGGENSQKHKPCLE